MDKKMMQWWSFLLDKGILNVYENNTLSNVYGDQHFEWRILKESQHVNGSDKSWGIAKNNKNSVSHEHISKHYDHDNDKIIDMETIGSLWVIVNEKGRGIALAFTIQYSISKMTRCLKLFIADIGF